MKKQLSFFIGFIIPLLAAVFIWAYENTEMHPGLNNRIVDQFISSYSSTYGINTSINLNFNDKLFSGPKVTSKGLFDVVTSESELSAKNWIAHGGFSCDEPEVPASLRHFYDPLKKSGQAYLTNLADKVCSALNYTNPKMDAKTYALTADDNLWSWIKAKGYLKRALEYTSDEDKSEFFAKAYRALGETLHLLADMGCPPHVRNDAHPAYLSGDNLYGDWDPYEELVGFAENLAFANAKEVVSLTSSFRSAESADELFELMATFTNANFFSDDTQFGNGIEPNNGMPAYPSPVLGGDAVLNTSDNYYYSTSTGHSIKMCEAKSYFFGGKYTKIDFECVQSQAEVLLPSIVEAGANLMKLFIPKLSVQINNADDLGNISGEIIHTKSNEFSEEILFTGKVDIYEGSNLIVSLNAINGKFSSTSASLTKNTSIKAVVDEGGIKVTSDIYSVKEGVTVPDCLEELKSRKYVRASAGFYFDEGSGRFYAGVLGPYGSYDNTLDDTVWDEITWSGNTFSAEQTIIFEIPEGAYIGLPAYDTLYYRIEGSISSDGTTINYLYLYRHEVAVSYSGGNVFMNKKERSNTLRLSGFERAEGTTDCLMFNRYKTDDISSIVSEFVGFWKEIEYYHDDEQNKWIEFDVKQDFTLNPAQIVEYDAVQVTFPFSPH